MKPRNFLESINCAAEGIIHSLKTQIHLKIHFLFLIFLIFLSLILNVTIQDFAILMILSAVVIAAEIFNTAIEYIMDVMIKDFHIMVKKAKDVSAGAVLFLALIAMLVGTQILAKYVIHEEKSVANNVVFIATVSAFLTVIAVIFFKAIFNSGRPFRGGMPSGHSALSFSFFVSICMATGNTIIIVLSFLLALVVSFSRFYLGIHKKQEVLYGAVLGGGITFLMFTIFYR